MADRKIKNASDRIAVKEAKKREKLVRDNELADLKDVLKTKAGRRVFWRILSRCGVYESRWSANARVHFDLGERNIGLFLLGEITETDEELLFQMMRENKIDKEKLNV